ncbi:MBL fold metallo-hydrolase [Actinotalea sp. JY-7876]|uniref:MBL fold metallo-hydrolase n=1 Tax=Actinotalea sp. JY-7876 TaxID=2758442 RepID=UPI0021080233|nr:MBL fold metallo-hydrolase [Actinotalea sp. JY-7876]
MAWGDVTPGGPSAVLELDEVVVRKASVGPMDNNAYLLTCRHSGEQLLVDAAADPGRLLALVREGGGARAPLSAIVTTHRHADHHGALERLVALTGAATLAGAADADHLPVPVDRRLEDGDVIRLGALELTVVALRGHTPGSVALAYREPTSARTPGGAPGRVHLFTGDSLFPGGPGRTLDPESFRSLMTDLTERVLDRFDDRTCVHPGHGRGTTLGAERPQVEGWWARGW